MQFKIKKTALATALATALTGGALMSVSTAVQAVNIAQDGLGEVLEFSYYTVRGGWSTLFNITNTSNETVIIKVRWREALNSREVRDFNVILSPYDTWAAVTKINAGGAEIVTADNSCTMPELKTTRDLDGSSFGAGLTGKTFTNRAYVLDNTGAFPYVDNRDSKNNTPVSVFAGSSGSVSPLPNEAAPNPNLDRAREGYFEVFNMGSISNERPDIVDGGVLPTQAQIIDAKTIARYAKHQEEVSDNKARPRDCTLVRSVLRNRKQNEISTLLNEPKNVLKGRAILVKGAEGIAAGYDPLVLADWRSTSIYTDPSQIQPNLNNTEPFALVINDGQVNKRKTPLTATQSASMFFDTSGASLTAGADAVSALISRSNVMSDYNIKSGSATSWILSFPTKNFYVDEAIYRTNNQSPIPYSAPVGVANTAPLAPFTGASAFDARSCFSFRLSMWDREEYNVIADQFSPPIPPNGRGMCYETNILSFGRGANLFNSTVINRAVTGGDNKNGLPALSGTATMGFGPGGFDGTLSGSGVAVGDLLPVVGTRVEVRNRGDATVNYGLANEVVYTGDKTRAGLNQAVIVTTPSGI